MLWDVLKWFLLFFFGLFALWVISGGPERGGGETPFISPPGSVGSPSTPSVRGGFQAPN